MPGQTILFSIGSLHFSLRGLLLLVCLGAYAAVCLLDAPKHSIKRSNTAYAVLCAFTCMFFLAKAGFLLLDRNAAPSLLCSGEITFLALVGFWTGLRLYCRKSPRAFQKLLKLMAPPFFALGSALYLLRDGASGVPSAHGGLFRYTDPYCLHRWNAPLLQGAALLVLLALSCIAQALTERLQKQPRQKRIQHVSFRIKLLPISLAALSIVLPCELLRDSTQRRFLGIPAEALLIWLALLSLMTLWLVRRLSQQVMPLRIKLINAALSLLFPLLSVFTLSSSSAAACFIMIAAPVFVTLSPLYPFIKRSGRLTKKRRRRFS